MKIISITFFYTNIRPHDTCYFAPITTPSTIDLYPVFCYIPFMIVVNGLTKDYGITEIFKDVSFSVPERRHIGLVGVNGSGKTTLLNILAGKEYHEKGKITGIKGKTIGYLPQIPVLPEDLTVYQYLLSSFDKLIELKKKMESEKDPPKQHLLNEQFEHLGGNLIEPKIGKVCYFLNISEDLKKQNINSISGGEKSRVLLAHILLSEPDIILLDEPTNHIDIEGIIFLENFLNSYKGTFIVVSHDRQFLNNCVNHIYYIENKSIKIYKGNYDKFETEYEHEKQRLEKTYKQQTEYIKKTEKFIRDNIEGQNTKQAQSRMKKLEKLERIKLPEKQTAPAFKWNETFRSGNEILHLENLSFSYDSRKILSNINFNVYAGHKIAITGKNGAGKTTLLRLIKGELIPSSGSIIKGNNINTAYYKQEFHFTGSDETLLNMFLNETEYFTVGEARSKLALAGFFANDIEKKWNNLSGGEKAKYMILKLTVENPNVLLLDEPTNHLDIQSVKYLINMLNIFPETIIFTSHDRSLIRNVATDVVLIKNGTLETFNVSELDNVFNEIVTSTQKKKPASEKKPDKKKQLRIIKASIREIENKIETLEKSIIEIDKKFADPHNNSDYNKLNDLVKEKKQLENKVKILYNKYESEIEELSRYES